VTGFLAALQFLTIFPWAARMPRSAEDLGAAAIFFPVVGFLLGAVLLLADIALEPFSPPILSGVILVAVLAWLTRALHLDGLADTFDGLGAGGDRERILRVMDDSRTGAFGVVAVVLLLFLKIHALEAIDTERWRVLLAAPALSRWAMVLHGYGSAAAKTGLGSTLIEHLKTKHIVFATVIAVVLTVAVLRGAGIVMMLVVAAFSTASKKYFHRRLGGVTGDTFGAVGEISETLVLVGIAMGAR
jgi:adenosylcobinamide-GDP ribazoletransferase